MIKLSDILKQLLIEKADRCKRIADRKYDKPSAYKSGAIVRCRKGNIWKGLKEELENDFIAYKGVPINFIDHNRPMFFTKYKEGAEHYARVNNGKVIQANISFKNPLIVNAEKPAPIPIIDKDNNVIGTFSDKNINEKIKALGYDGLIINKKFGDEIDGWEVLTFDSSTRNIITEKIDEAKKETLRTWFKRKGAPGKEGGWVDCNTCRDGKCKSCGRKKGEKRAKYPSCRPTPAQCKQPGKGKKWGKTK